MPSPRPAAPRSRDAEDGFIVSRTDKSDENFTMNRRPAVTLLEVLVSIFLMGIGLLSILALFPLGALRMAQAIQDDRAGHLAVNGLAVAQTFNLRGDPEITVALSNNPPRP